MTADDDDRQRSAEDDMAAEWDAALAEQDDDGAGEQDAPEPPKTKPAGRASGKSDSGPEKARLDPLKDETGDGAADENRNLDVIMDIPVTMSMEIGRTRISIRNLLQLNQGSVVELDRLAGEPLDVMVNGTLIAHGEVVVVNDRFGIRLTDVISPAERVKKLK